MMSFIAKPIFFRKGEGGGEYPVRLSSRIRGEEQAEYLGAEYTQKNPSYDNRIYIKPTRLDYVRDGDYVDVLDSDKTLSLIKDRPGVKLLSMTPHHHKYLKDRFDNDTTLIPHPSINFENETRTRNKKLTGGMISKGVPQVYELFNQIKDRLATVDIDFKPCLEYKTKQEMIQFYKDIDFLVIWYPQIDEFRDLYYLYPGKIINAASFGIPTISQYIEGYQEMEGYYIPAESHDDIVERALDIDYDGWGNILLEKSKEYHISRIAELYKKLWT